jgi:type II secretory pathway pseudopilin PulG
MLGGKNKQHRQPLGYTIVEVMIVLAVSGFMFIVAANFINGKQQKTAFTQGSNETGSKLQQSVDDVTDGHYSDVPLQCTISGSVLSANTSGVGTQGETPSCVFLGKLIRFYSPSGGQKDHYGIYSVAAARSITSFPNNLVGAISGLTTQSIIPQNLYVQDMTVVDASGGSHTNVFNIGFLQSVGNVNGAGVYLTGAQQPVQLAFADTNSGNESVIAGMTIKPAKSATVCLTDGRYYAHLLIGGTAGSDFSSSNNNQLNISVQQLGTTSC